MFSRDNRGDDLFSISTFDAPDSDKVIIKEKEAQKKKVRRRVKKGTKDTVLAKRQEIKDASKVKIVKNKEKKTKKSVYDTVSFDVMDLDDAMTSSRPDIKPDTKSANNYKLPRLSEINKKDDFDNDDLGSDFRKSSADWKDAVIPDYSGLDDLRDNGSFFDGFKSTTWVQWVAGGLAVALFVSSILTTNVYAKLQCADNKAEAFSKLSVHEDNTFEQVALAVESVEEPIALEEAKPQLGKVLSLVLSSVEKDLKIKLIDEDETLVKNVPWSVTVADNDGNSSEEVDDDQDGIIHMTDVNAGDYSVTLNPNDSLADFELPASAQMVSVKAKVEYKVIANIKDEIKSEKEINAAAEDAAGNQAAEAEAAPPPVTDTVEFVESTKTVDGEEYVEATPDLTKTAKYKEAGKLLAIAEKIKNTAAANFGKNSLAFMKLVAEETSPAELKPAETPAAEPPAAETPAHEHSYSNDGKCECGAECPHSNKKESVSYTDGDCTKGGQKTVTCTVCNKTLDSVSVPAYDSHDFSGNTCSRCGQAKPEENHNLSYSTNNNGTHKVICSVSGCSQGHNKDSESCEYDGNKCKKCNYTKPADHTHAFRYTANNDGTHKIECTTSGCPGLSDTEKKGTCDTSGTNGACSKCGYKKTEEASVTLSGSSSVKVGERITVSATVTPSGKKVTGVSFTDGSVAGASIDGNSITVKGLKAGSTKMKVSCDNDKSAEMTITVTADESTYADDAQLYDASKNALYVKEGDTYRLAKYKDYKNDPGQKFYRKQETFVYTGWQTIDGVKCYFDKDHNRVTGKQIIGGVEYDFGDSGSVSTGSGSLGIDVSKYQPSINWSAVKSSGVDYVIIRCGYRGSSTGVLVEDPYFKSHIKGAKAAGLKVGVYFFTTALTEAEAVEEASMCAYLCNGYGLDFPIFMDCESSPRAGYNGMSAGQRTAVIKAFCNTIKSAGYSAGVYANKTWLSSYINAGELSGYKIWLAQYNSAGPTYSGRYDMWQYTSKGSVNGISGYVDMNRCYYR